MLNQRQSISDSGVVLHRRPYRETSMIVDFFTIEHGRISAVVRGMRQAKSDRKSLLQPFQSLKLTLTGKTDLKNLTQVEAESASIQLQGDALYCGFYMNELLTRVIPQGIAASDLYSRYLQCLTHLTQTSELDIVMRQFEFALLDELGVLPDLTTTVQGGDVTAHGIYRFQSGEGIIESVAGKGAFSGEWLLDIVSENWTDKSRQLAKAICRQALLPFLGDKPLHSRALFKRA
jgi:DNA repair protein RecO (recombination protein O)